MESRLASWWNLSDVTFHVDVEVSKLPEVLVRVRLHEANVSSVPCAWPLRIRIEVVLVDEVDRIVVITEKILEHTSNLFVNFSYISVLHASVAWRSFRFWSANWLRRDDLFSHSDEVCHIGFARSTHRIKGVVLEAITVEPMNLHNIRLRLFQTRNDVQLIRVLTVHVCDDVHELAFEIDHLIHQTVSQVARYRSVFLQRVELIVGQAT